MVEIPPKLNKVAASYLQNEANHFDNISNYKTTFSAIHFHLYLIDIIFKRPKMIFQIKIPTTVDAAKFATAP